MRTKLFIAAVTLGVVTLFSSCNKVPQAEIDLASSAIDSVKLVDAEHYAPEAFAALQDSLKVTLEAVEAQKSKMFGKYSAIKTQLAYIAAQAPVVKQQAITRKAEMKTESDTLLAEVKVLLDDTKKLIAKAPKGKEGKAALEQMNAEIAEIETAINDAQVLYTSENYYASVDKLKAAKDKCAAIAEELKAAISKTGRK